MKTPSLIRTCLGPLLLSLPLVSAFAASPADHSGHRSYSYLKYSDVRGTGWMDQLLQSEVRGFAGRLDEFAPEISRQPFIENQVVARNGRVALAWWDGESAGNWIDGLVRLAQVTDDPRLKQKVERWLADLGRKQTADTEPYIGVYPHTHESGDRWQSVSGELWPQSRAYLAILAAYKESGSKALLEKVQRAADLTIERFGPERPDLDPDYYKKVIPHGVLRPHLNSHGLMIVEPMLELYAITGKQRYYDFAARIYETYRFFNDRFLAGGTFLHGVHICENIRVPAMLYAAGGDAKLLEETQRGMERIESTYLNTVGALTADEWVSPARPDRSSEYCTMTEWVLTTTEMAAITGDLGYADLAEHCYFNAAMGARLPDGTGIQYLSYPNQLVVDRDLNPYASFGPNHSPLCCNPNSARLHPYFVNRMWMTAADGTLTAVLYGPSEVTHVPEGSDHRVTIATDSLYPFSDVLDYEVRMDRPASFPLAFRVPGWCTAPAIEINGKSWPLATTSGVIRIEREWSPGDVIRLSLPMEIVPRTNPETGLASINRGPLVYALKVPATEVVREEVGPGFAYRDFRPEEGFRWNLALSHDDADWAGAFRLRENPDYQPGDHPWATPPFRIEVPVYPADHWQAGAPVKQFEQPAVPKSPIYEYMKDKSKVSTAELVPYGSTQLRIVAFPQFIDVH